MEQEKKNTTGKRELLLHHAFQVFIQKGFHLTKVDEIAKQAGIGKGTIYEYFSSKEELFRETLKDKICHHEQLLKESMEQEVDPIKKLEAFYQTHSKIYMGNENMAKMIISNLGFINEEMHNWLLNEKYEFVKYLEAILEEGVQKKMLRPLHKEVMAVVVFSLTEAIFSEGFNIDATRIPIIMNILLGGIKA